MLYEPEIMVRDTKRHFSITSWLFNDKTKNTMKPCKPVQTIFQSIHSELYFFKHSSGEWLIRYGDYTWSLLATNRPDLSWRL